MKEEVSKKAIEYYGIKDPDKFEEKLAHLDDTFVCEVIKDKGLGCDIEGKEACEHCFRGICLYWYYEDKMDTKSNENEDKIK
jgi:hypothetical protein